MPELPEVETTLRGIHPFVDGSILTSVEVRNASLRWPVPVDQISALQGLSIQSAKRRAKYIILDTEQGALMLHLGMSGSVRMLSQEDVSAPGKHDHIDLVFTKNNEQWTLRYNDPRRFGSLLFIEPNQEQKNHPLLEKLGPEPLSEDFNGELLFDLSRKRTVAVKNFIMNGHVVVGVGNIYASEALFMAKVKPTRAAGKVTKKEYEKIAESIKVILAKAIQVGGTTLRDFTGANGKAGYFQQTLNVYDRDKEQCTECDSIIQKIVIGQRSSFYCSNCQK